MKESARSLRIYLILSGSLGVVSNVVQIAQHPQSPVTLAVNLVFLGFCAALLFCGARLGTLLDNNPRAIVNVLYAGIGLNLALIALFLLGGAAPAAAVRPLLGIALLLYLRSNVLRLSGERSERSLAAAA